MTDNILNGQPLQNMNFSVYVDESGAHSDAPVLCLAGYLFAQPDLAPFTLKWQLFLDRHQLPFFHMVDCAQGAGTFRNRSKEERSAAIREAIAIIHEHAQFGFAATVEKSSYEEIFAPLSNERWSAYHFCVNNCLSLAREWAEENDVAPEIDFYFENGHIDESNSDQIMSEVFGIPEVRQRFHYKSHIFAKKRDYLPLQAADVLAWQWHINEKRRIDGPMKNRADLIALLRPQDRVLRFDREALIGARDHAISQKPNLYRHMKSE